VNTPGTPQGPASWEEPVSDLRFEKGYPIDSPGEVALEDYARVLTRAEAAEALRAEGSPERVTGVRIAAAEAALTAAVRKDIEDFARDLARRGGGSGLGWA
jgi:hypothetical protein